jgi:dTDP-glucose pyrophosphorylase
VSRGVRDVEAERAAELEERGGRSQLCPGLRDALDDGPSAEKVAEAGWPKAFVAGQALGHGQHLVRRPRPHPTGPHLANHHVGSGQCRLEPAGKPQANRRAGVGASSSYRRGGVVDEPLATCQRPPVETQLKRGQQAGLPRFGERPYQAGRSNARAAQDGYDRTFAFQGERSSMTTAFSGVHVLIQAGGKGTRLHPATADLPKPMLQVAGIPMVERLLRTLLAAGADRVTVIIGYHGEVIRRHVEGLSDLTARIDFFVERQPLGNAGALGQVEVERPRALFLFGDLVTDLDFRELIARHAVGTADVLLTSHHESHRLQLGELLVEGTRVVGYQEKPEKRFLICSGIGVFRREVLRVIPKDGTPLGLSDLITLALRAGHSVAHWEHGAFWMDVNSPDALRLADERLGQVPM